MAHASSVTPSPQKPCSPLLAWWPYEPLVGTMWRPNLDRLGAGKLDFYYLRTYIVE